MFESRGNKAPHRLDQLNNEMICGLHWGPANAPSFDRFYLTQGLYKGTVVASRLTHPRITHRPVFAVYRNFFNEDYCAFALPRYTTLFLTLLL